jgi:hypothetical protein
MFLVGHAHVDEVEILGDDGSVRRESKVVPVESPGEGEAREKFKKIVALTKVVPNYASATRVEGESTVTHGILRIVDFPPAAEKKDEPAPPKMP